MGDAIEQRKLFGIGKNNAPQGFSVEPVRQKSGGKGPAKLREHSGVVLEKHMIHGVAVENQRAHGFQLPESRGLAHPGGARDADERELFREGFGNRLLRQRPRAEDEGNRDILL